MPAEAGPRSGNLAAARTSSPPASSETALPKECNMPRIVHFEIHADDPERAIGFYTALFGWEISRWGEMDYWLIRTGEGTPGIDGGLTRRQGPPPPEGQAVTSYVCTADVPS